MTGRSPAASSRREVVGSCPLDCPDACSWVVTVDESGTAVRLRGNHDHPFTRGGLCKKVNSWLSFAADPQRITTPLRRVGPKGSGQFVEIGWDDALDEIASRFSTIIDESGPAAIWPFAGTGNVGFLQGGAGPAGDRLWNHLGVSGHDLTICSVSGHVGLAYTLGLSATFDPEDIVHAGTVMIWGSNTLVANQHLWPFVAEARRRGAPIIVVDPVRSRTAQRADVHLAPLPGTDGALALGLAHALIELGAADKEFLRCRTLGWEEFRELAATWSPERAAQVCGLEPNEITDLARVIADHGPLALKVGQGAQRHANGGQAIRTISCLPAVTGAYGQAGGGLVYSTSGPYQLDVASAGGAHLGARPRRLAMTNLARNLLFLDDPPVEALFVTGANPVVSNPDTAAVRQGLSREDLFTVVVEVFPTETAAYADLVLPSTMQHEQYEMNDSFSHLYLNWNEPAVAAPGSCLPHTEIVRRLATAMGIDEPALQADDLTLAAALLGGETYRRAGITLERLREQGWIRLPETDGGFNPVRDRFATDSGLFEFASARAEVDGHARLPDYLPPRESGQSTEGIYALVAAAGEWHVNSTFASSEVNRRRTARPPVIVHPDDARRDGLIDGQLVEVGNERGSFRAQLRVAESTRRGVAATTKGWWRMGVNDTVAERDSDMGRGAVYHDNGVVIRPC